MIPFSSLGLRSNETKKAFSTLRALVEVMESLSEDAGPDGVGGLITEEVFVFLSIYFLGGAHVHETVS